MQEIGLSLCVEDIERMTMEDAKAVALPHLHRQGFVLIPSRWAFKTLWLHHGEPLPESVVCTTDGRHDHILVRATVARPSWPGGKGHCYEDRVRFRVH